MEEEEEEDEEEDEDGNRPVLMVTQTKKPRVVWTVEMHQQVRG